MKTTAYKSTQITTKNYNLESTVQQRRTVADAVGGVGALQQHGHDHEGAAAAVPLADVVVQSEVLAPPVHLALFRR